VLRHEQRDEHQGEDCRDDHFTQFDLPDRHFGMEVLDGPGSIGGRARADPVPFEYRKDHGDPEAHPDRRLDGRTDGGADVPGSEALRVEDAGEHAYRQDDRRHYGREEHEQSTIVVVQPGTDQIAGPGGVFARQLHRIAE